MTARTERDQALHELREVRAALDRFNTLDQQWHDWQDDPNLIEAKRCLRSRRGKAATAYAELNGQEQIIPHGRTDNRTFDQVEACLELGIANDVRQAFAILAFADLCRERGSET